MLVTTTNPHLPAPNSQRDHLGSWNLGVGELTYFFSSSTTSASITSPPDACSVEVACPPPPGAPPGWLPPLAVPAPAVLAFLYIASAARCCAVLSASIVRFISATSPF